MGKDNEKEEIGIILECDYFEIEEEKEAKKDIYPLTLYSDRYNGSYSGANFIAFNLDPWELPEEIGGGDGEEMAFWENQEKNKTYLVGKGSTPQEAFNDLYEKIEKNGVD